jgi:hypothetical protein
MSATRPRPNTPGLWALPQFESTAAMSIPKASKPPRTPWTVACTGMSIALPATPRSARSVMPCCGPPVRPDGRLDARLWLVQPAAIARNKSRPWQFHAGGAPDPRSLRSARASRRALGAGCPQRHGAAPWDQPSQLGRPNQPSRAGPTSPALNCGNARNDGVRSPEFSARLLAQRSQNASCWEFLDWVRCWSWWVGPGAGHQVMSFSLGDGAVGRDRRRVPRRPLGADLGRAGRRAGHHGSLPG